MLFPYSYSKTLSFDLKDFNLKKAKTNLIDASNQYKISNIYKKNNNLYFTSKNSLTGFKYEVGISIRIEDEINIKYVINLLGMIKIIVILLVFIPLISEFSLINYLLFSAIIVVIFYSVNLIYIDKSVQRLIHEVILEHNTNKTGNETLSKEQIDWINNPDKCSACGSWITIYDKYCPDCGILLTRKAKKSPHNITKFGDIRVYYDLRIKK